MFAPIRPRPIIPSCIRVTFKTPSLYFVRNRIIDCVRKFRERLVYLEREVQARSATIALVQRFEIAEGLRALERLERRHPRNREIERRVGGELEEDARVRAALVELAGRVQEARAETDGGRDLERVANLQPDVVQRQLVRVVHLDVRRERDVVARLDLREDRGDGAAQIAAEIDTLRARERNDVRDAGR